jgi:hypothetical protein
MWEEAAFAYLEVLSQNMPGDVEEISEDSLSRYMLSLPRMIIWLQGRAMCLVNGNGSLNSTAYSDSHVA